MANDHAERRLVAVLAADIVGYSRLNEADEAGTLAAIRALRCDVVDPLLDEYHGRIAGAISVPVITELLKEALAKVAGKDDPIIFSCHGKYCGDSAYSAAKALVWGYRNVYHFAGGFPAWEDAHYPIESTPAVADKSG